MCIVAIADMHTYSYYRAIHILRMLTSGHKKREDNLHEEPFKYVQIQNLPQCLIFINNMEYRIIVLGFMSHTITS